MAAPGSLGLMPAPAPGEASGLREVFVDLGLGLGLRLGLALELGLGLGLRIGLGLGLGLRRGLWARGGWRGGRQSQSCSRCRLEGQTTIGEIPSRQVLLLHPDCDLTPRLPLPASVWTGLLLPLGR